VTLSQANAAPPQKADSPRKAAAEQPAARAKGLRRKGSPRSRRSAKPFVPLRRKRPEEDAPLVSGPLSHQHPTPGQTRTGPASSPDSPPPPRVDAVADRILTGVTAKGEATARIDLNVNLGDFAGAQVDLVAGPRGLEVSVMAATAAARRAIQAKLSDLADALAQRGVYARKIAVSVRQGDNRGGSRQDGRR